MFSRPPTLQYRKGNANQLSFIISSADALIIPDDTLSIFAEIRASDVGRVIGQVPLSVVDADEGTIEGLLPDIASGLYVLGLFFDYDGEPDFRVGVANLEIVPVGRLVSVADATGLNIQLTETKQVLRVVLDNTPSAAIAAFYAAQVRADVTVINQAKEDALDAAASVTQLAQDAHIDAQAANQSALDAHQSKLDSADSASAAASSASSASQSAQAANQSKQDAQTAAQNAQTVASSVALLLMPPFVAEGTTFSVTANQSWLALGDTDVEGLVDADGLIDEL